MGRTVTRGKRYHSKRIKGNKHSRTLRKKYQLMTTTPLPGSSSVITSTSTQTSSENRKNITKDIVSESHRSADLEDLKNMWEKLEADNNSINKHELFIEKEDPYKKLLSGNRIVELGYVLKWAMVIQQTHSKECDGVLYPYKECPVGLGLVRSIKFNCTKCSVDFEKLTEDPNKAEFEINIGAVWGTLATGATYSHLEEQLACLNIPAISKREYITMENNLAQVWEQQLICDTDMAAKIEADIARKKGHVDQDGIPYITVYLDGGWSKRSYGHNYNASSGMAVIIGKETGKVLYVGVRNKFCAVCARTTNNGKTPKKHVCFRNWSGSSPSMEADIIVEGFCYAEELYGIRYKTFIADGDSSVHARIVEKVPYGRMVTKIECVNHSIKNYGKSLFNIKNDTKVSLQVRQQLTTKKIQELQKVAQAAIYNHCINKNKEESMTDLKNGPLHVYNDHTFCKPYYCHQVGESNSSELTKVNNSGLRNYLYGTLEHLLAKADRLIDNETNNRAECFMNILARFTAGKRLNLTTRGSFQARCHLTGMRYNKSFEWHRSPWKTVCKSSPGRHFKKYMNKHTQEKKTKQIRKELFPKVKATKKQLPNLDYGPRAAKPEPPEEHIITETVRILKSLQVSGEEQKIIENTTKGQFENQLYLQERSLRLTASLFGQVVKKRMSTSCHNLVKQVLVTTHLQTPAINYGKIKEKVAIKLLEEKLNIKVEPAGLFVDLEHGCLGASPDGLVNDTHIVEVKCLHSLAVKHMSLSDAVEDKNIAICLEKYQSGIRLKRTHNYYYQIQGQLNIADRKTCYFVVFIEDEAPIFVEEIEKDEVFWRNHMLPHYHL